LTISANDGPIPRLDPSTLPPFAGSPGFADLAASELGNLGTDQDGFDAAFNEAAQGLSDAADALAAMDSDVADATAASAAFDFTDATDLQAQLAPVSDGIDANVTDFQTAIPPTPPSTVGPTPPSGSTPPLQRGQTDPNTYGPFDMSQQNAPGVFYTQEIKLPVMVVGDPLQTWETLIDAQIPVGKTGNNLIVETGDPDVLAFSAIVDKADIQSSVVALTAVIYAKATKPGRFPFQVQYNLPQIERVTFLIGGVTIIPA